LLYWPAWNFRGASIEIDDAIAPLRRSARNQNPRDIVIFSLFTLAVLAVVFCSAIFGILLRRTLPAHHLADETRSVIILATGVVGTLTALVLGLLIGRGQQFVQHQE
jgi:hypothetical protein